MSRSFYDVLEVPADASQEAIRDAYREKVKDYHPDVSDDPDAEERFKRIKRAEDAIGDPEERRRYDRLGHERYVDGVAARPTSDAGHGVGNTDDVRGAASSAADGEHDSGGGRGAGWRERARRARGDPADWFENDVGYDASGPTGTAWTGRASASSGTAGASETPGAGGTAEAGGTAGASGTAGAGASRGTRRRATDGSRATTGAGAAGQAGARSTAQRDVAGAPGREHAATDAWGHRDREARRHTHAVHEWRDAARRRSWRPALTQDELVFLAAAIPLYPILLAMTVFPPFPLVANVAIGALTLAFVAFLFPRPAMALPVFGTWSIGVPALLLAFDIPLVSLPGTIGLLGTWIPFVYAAAAAFVLLR